ncbi:uncharacterized protein PODANS_6_4070 [Podospora anserina S mat+]|uniref:Podospora anserina S mat+ genomic DNA chromosome 6, supercontig 2 n=1 Tax=Podospora anserina (strain S / ATCC MYA-4624 / DSM 980 / FGSC 10383) TaxID=515849 RepID=B2B1Q2_PODAN|nr:uncharacterized protein PODANS_6_4070 [Podospora anserina S mat+]CAP71037.1 unnamed protein product [Podospora anserina S mat+]CDP30437.1 Putative protein of unknown function [Podospora anserina S mat+]
MVIRPRQHIDKARLEESQKETGDSQKETGDSGM